MFNFIQFQLIPTQHWCVGAKFSNTFGFVNAETCNLYDCFCQESGFISILPLFHNQKYQMMS